MFQGLRTVIYAVNDIEKAKAWYAELLGQQPYYAQPFYVGFKVGGFELGLDPDLTGVKTGNNAVVYWGVADAKAVHARLLALGAREHKALEEVAERTFVASVVDPFGNVVGIIQNPHFKIE